MPQAYHFLVSGSITNKVHSKEPGKINEFQFEEFEGAPLLSMEVVEVAS